VDLAYLYLPILFGHPTQAIDLGRRHTSDALPDVARFYEIRRQVVRKG